MRRATPDVRWLLRDHPRMSFATRVKLTVGAFRILRGWRITTRANFRGYSGSGLVSFVERDPYRREANIHPWQHGIEPADYVLHEVLHIVHRALILLMVTDGSTRRTLEEWTVRDTCKVMGLPRGRRAR